jgi:hypothetical protein
MDFIGFCARGHERIDFDWDREGFERHMVSAHGAKRLRPGGTDPAYDRLAPGWKDGKITKPYAWKPPKRDADGGAKRLNKWVATRELVIEEVGDDETARAS